MTTWCRHRALPLVCLLAVVALGAAPAAGGPGPAARHCTASVVGRDAHGVGILGPVVCSSEQRVGLLLAGSVTHYKGAGGTGDSLTIPDICGTGLYNLPAAWDNVISSTSSTCSVTHYDTDGGSGSNQTTSPGLVNLTTLDNRAESAYYW
jgi:hypothetical protein